MKNKECGFVFIFLIFLFILISSSVVHAVETSNNGKHLLDLRLSAGAGAFYYPQSVDGGYYVNGYPYDLTWYGAQIQFSGDAQFFLPQMRELSVGFGGSWFTAINPKGMSSDYSVSVDARNNGVGGYGGISASYWLNNIIRLNILAGYGGTGVEENYGGYGFTFVVGATYLLPGDNNIIGGLGVKFLYMNLYSPGDSDTRSEKGGYMAMLLEASVDWFP